jgi:hypothetical protein
MFQSLTRPYFFHGSPVVCPYLLKSYAGVSLYAEACAAQTYRFDVEGGRLAASCEPFVPIDLSAR